MTRDFSCTIHILPASCDHFGGKEKKEDVWTVSALPVNVVPPLAVLQVSKQIARGRGGGGGGGGGRGSELNSVSLWCMM